MRGCTCGFFTTSIALWIAHLLKRPDHDERARYADA
jgi:hypothetical protein